MVPRVFCLGLSLGLPLLALFETSK